jgi:hypothetical protein
MAIALIKTNTYYSPLGNILLAYLSATAVGLSRNEQLLFFREKDGFQYRPDLILT